MVKVLRSVIEKIIGNTNYLRAEIAVDTASSLTTEVASGVLVSGSIAWDISTGDFYGYNGETWYKQDGSGAYSAEVTPSVQSLGNGRSIPETKALPEEDLRREEPVIEEEPEEKEER